MPHKEVVNLPTSWTRENVYKMFVADQLQRFGGHNNMLAKGKIVSKSHFMTLKLSQHLPEFVICKVSRTLCRTVQ
jgi:hypothetical protein